MGWQIPFAMTAKVNYQHHIFQSHEASMTLLTKSLTQVKNTKDKRIQVCLEMKARVGVTRHIPSQAVHCQTHWLRYWAVS